MDALPPSVTTPDLPLPQGQPGRVPGHALLGNLPALLREKQFFFARIAREHGDLVQLKLPLAPPLYFVNDPDLIEQVLLTRASEFHRDPFSRNLRAVLGDGLIAAEGARWRKERRALQPLFTPRSVEAYEQAMIEESAITAASWGEGQRVDILKHLSDLTLRILVRAVFPKVLSPEERARITQVAETGTEYLKGVFSTGQCLPLWVPSPTNWALKRALVSLDALVYEMIVRARSQAVRGTDLVSRLLDARDEQGGALTDKELRDGCTVRDAAFSESFRRARPLHARAMGGWIGKAPSALRLSAVRWRPACVHRFALRNARDRTDDVLLAAGVGR